MAERFIVRKNHDISQSGAWQVRSVDLDRARGCKDCGDTGVLLIFGENEPCYMCEIDNWVAYFRDEEDAKLFALAREAAQS
jgi:hypothetical protein